MLGSLLALLVSLLLVGAAAALLAALPEERREELSRDAAWAALEQLAAGTFGSEQPPSNTAAAVRLPLGPASTADLTSAAVESVKRTGSASAGALQQAVARCASLLRIGGCS